MHELIITLTKNRQIRCLRCFKKNYVKHKKYSNIEVVSLRVIGITLGILVVTISFRKKCYFHIVKFKLYGNVITIMKIIDEGTAQIVMHPVRFKILQCVRKASKPLFVEQIAKAVSEHPRLVSHHLDVLQEIGLIDCKYELVKAKGSNRKVAVRLCSPTPKLSEVFKDIAEAVAKVK